LENRLSPTKHTGCIVVEMVLSKLEVASTELRRARLRLLAVTDNARAAALEALQEGATEVAVAKELGVNRLTVRKWRGK
jgi:CBS domain containing-hemolysin-like protein